jgi:hypothetical protein
LSGTDTKLDGVLVDNIKLFLQFHNNGGTLKLDEQMAVQAVKQAISFFDIGSQDSANVSNRSIASRLGYCSSSGQINSRFNEFREAAREMQLFGERFERRLRNTRSDCYRLAAKQCVWDYVHSDEGSRLDSNSFYVYEVRNPTTEEKTKCPQRIWNEITLEQKYESFQESSILEREYAKKFSVHQFAGVFESHHHSHVWTYLCLVYIGTKKQLMTPSNIGW